MTDSAKPTDAGAMRDFNELRESGILWLINRVVFNPRGLALAIYFEDGEGDKALGWSLIGDGHECWTFSNEMDDDGFAKATATLAAATGKKPNEEDEQE